MYKLMLCMAAAALVSACASHAPAAGQQQTLAQALQQAGGTSGVQNGPGGGDLICTSAPEIGSHLSHVNCLTPAQAAARQKADQEAVQHLQQQSALCTGPGCLEL